MLNSPSPWTHTQPLATAPVHRPPDTSPVGISSTAPCRSIPPPTVQPRKRGRPPKQHPYHRG